MSGPVSTRHPEHPGVGGVVPYPPAVAAAYRAAGFWTGETIDAVLRASVAAAGARTALVDRDRTVSYAELDARVGALANQLATAGLQPRDRVVVQLPNISEFFVAVFAVIRLGAVPVFALPAHRRIEIEHFVRVSEAVAYLTCRTHAGFDHAQLAADLLRDAATLRLVLFAEDFPSSSVTSESPEWRGASASAGPAAGADVALLQVSGGSTGTPKLIPRTHDDYLYSVRESVRICGIDEHTVFLAALPVAHNFTTSSPGWLGVLHARGTVVLTDDASPPAVFDLVARHRVSVISAVPPLALAWLNSPLRTTADLSSLALLQVGGAKLSRQVAEQLEPAFGCRLQQVFGMAEGLVAYTRLDDDHETVVSTQGRPISPADHVRVVDDEDRPLRPGTPGHLLTRGPYTIRGYYRAPEHDRRAFTADGFYRTGDVVVQRHDGCLTVVGRAKDQINRGGEKVAPEEVENQLLGHPAVHDVSVVSGPDQVLGERVIAHVVLRRDVALPVRPADLRRYLVGCGLAGYKIPDEVRMVDRLPQTAVGKVDRTGLRTLVRPDRAGEEDRDGGGAA